VTRFRKTCFLTPWADELVYSYGPDGIHRKLRDGELVIRRRLKKHEFLKTQKKHKS
jgi:hypothetical protein